MCAFCGIGIGPEGHGQIRRCDSQNSLMWHQLILVYVVSKLIVPTDVPFVTDIFTRHVESGYNRRGRKRKLHTELYPSPPKETLVKATNHSTKKKRKLDDELQQSNALQSVARISNHQRKQHQWEHGTETMLYRN